MGRNLYLTGGPMGDIYQDNFGMPEDTTELFERESQFTISTEGLGTVSDFHKFRKTDATKEENGKAYEVWEYVETITDPPGKNVSSQVGQGKLTHADVAVKTAGEFPFPGSPKQEIKEAVKGDVEKE